MAAAKAKAFSISTSREGFRRAGYVFGKEPTVIPIADLTRNQITLLKNEPMLAVSEVEIDAAE